MNIQLDVEPHLTWIKDRIVFLTKTGSQAYGTQTPESDLDVRGIAVPPLQYHFGYKQRFDGLERTKPDLFIHDLRQFFRMAAGGNPSMLELLFTSPDDHLLVHPIGATLIQNREMFLSQSVSHSIYGYAVAQLRKAQMSADRQKFLPRANEVRSALIEEHGYDTKYAMHTVRLLRMGIELLTGKGLVVRRPDAEELVSIRNGAWSLDKVSEWAADTMDQMLALEKKTKLVPAPDEEKLDRLCTDLTEASFNFEVLMPIMTAGFKTQPMSFGTGTLREKVLSQSEVQ